MSQRIVPSMQLAILILLTAIASAAESEYRDGRPEATLRMDAKDHGVVLRQGDGPEQCGFYDAPGGDSTSHMKRNIGLAWLDLPLSPPANAQENGEIGRRQAKSSSPWRNRLIGDAGMPGEQRIAGTWARETWFDPNSNLEPAGLLGPVLLRTVRGVELE